MTLQEAAEQYANEASENLQKTFLTLGYEPETEAEREYWKSAFKAGYAKANNIHDQALSSALKEIAELTSWKNEMLQLWNKLDAYLQTRNDIRIGESKIDFAIKVMKERDELHVKVNEIQKDVEHNAKRALEIANERNELQADVKYLESVIGDLTKENSQMKFGLQLIISFDDSSIYSDPGEIAQEYLPKKYQ